MNLELNEDYCGFTLQEKKNIKEIKSDGYIFEHKCSGAKLIYIANDDDNKVFSISFRTPPTDNTGLPHILEHSVLCGSKKFPLKEPFVELLKGSLNTFLNAMTFSDKTMYPIASKNNKDFYNLMEVYLDAVFYPNIYAQPETLMQEGWHYEINAPEMPLTYKGVVYNEMKGAFSSPDTILERYNSQSLFPDTPYSLESGGDPDDIVKLTNEEFLNFHSCYYHPGNSYIFLYGDLDIIQALKFIDTEYLQEFKKNDAVNSSIALQKSFNERKKIVVDYPISKTAQLNKKTFLSLNYVIGNNLDGELCLAFDILTHLLLTMQGAPLKEALINAGIGQDISGAYHSEILQPYLTIGAINAEEDDCEKLVSVVEETLRDIVAKGINKKKIEAAINSREFALREANFGNYPKGLIYNINIMSSWLHEGNPFLHIEYEKYLTSIKQALGNDYFEKLIEKYILKNTHSSLVVVRPRQGMEDENNAKIKKELADYKASLNDVEVEDLINKTKKLVARQNAVDTIENLQKIKMVNLEDIKQETEKLPIEELICADTKVLLHDIFTNGIVYFRAYFDSGVIEEEDIPYLYLLSYFTGKLDTKNYSYAQLDNEIDIYTGGLNFECEVLSSYDDDTKIQPHFILKCKALMNNTEKMLAIAEEVLNNTLYSTSKRLAELLEEFFAKLEMEILENGRQVALLRIASYISPLGAYREKSSLTLYNFLKKINYANDDNRQKIASKVGDIAKKVFNQKKLVISIISEKKDYNLIQPILQNFLLKIERRDTVDMRYHLPCEILNEGLMTAGKVQYVLKAANYCKLGYNYSGVMKVVETILRFEYFWQKIRVQGGAYGAFLSFARNGLMYFGSYRDPNLLETIGVFDNTHNFLREFEATEREMTKYIIGTISQMDMPLTAQMKGDRAAMRWFQERPLDDVQNERRDILRTTVSDIRKMAELVEAAMKENCLCVYGNNEKIKDNSTCFGKVFDIVT